MRRLWSRASPCSRSRTVALLVAVPSNADAQPQVTDTAVDWVPMGSLVDEVQDVAPEATISLPGPRRRRAGSGVADG